MPSTERRGTGTGTQGDRPQLEATLTARIHVRHLPQVAVLPFDGSPITEHLSVLDGDRDRRVDQTASGNLRSGPLRQIQQAQRDARPQQQRSDQRQGEVDRVQRPCQLGVVFHIRRAGESRILFGGCHHREGAVECAVPGFGGERHRKIGGLTLGDLQAALRAVVLGRDRDRADLLRSGGDRRGGTGVDPDTTRPGDPERPRSVLHLALDRPEGDPALDGGETCRGADGDRHFRHLGAQLGPWHFLTGLRVLPRSGGDPQAHAQGGLTRLQAGSVEVMCAGDLLARERRDLLLLAVGVDQNGLEGGFTQ